MGFPRWLTGKESTCQCRRPGFDSWVGKIPWRRKWQPTLVVLPEKSQSRRAWRGTVHGVTKESDTTWRLNNNNDRTWPEHTEIILSIPSSEQVLLHFSAEICVGLWHIATGQGLVCNTVLESWEMPLMKLPVKIPSTGTPSNQAFKCITVPWSYKREEPWEGTSDELSWEGESHREESSAFSSGSPSVEFSLLGEVSFLNKRRFCHFVCVCVCVRARMPVPHAALCLYAQLWGENS